MNFTLNIFFISSRIPSYVNDKNNITNSNNPGLGLNLSSNISEKKDFSIVTNFTKTFITNKLNPTQNSSFYSINHNFKATLYLYKKFYVNPEYSLNSFIGFGKGFTRNIHLFNIGMGYKFFYNDRGDLKLFFFDLFNQNNFINRTVSEAFIENQSVLLLRRYYMLSFTYKF